MKLNTASPIYSVYAFSYFLYPTAPLPALLPLSVDIFYTQLASPEADSILMMHHTWHIYPLVIEEKAKQALHMIDEQMGF